MTDSDKSDITRRRVLALGGAAAGAAMGLGISSCSSDSAARTSGSPAHGVFGTDVCVLNSSVTEGSYYLDGALFRQDITDGKKGVPLTVRLTVRDRTGSCAPLGDAAVEIWHCDAGGHYSGYPTAGPGGTTPGPAVGSTATSGAADRTYLRGYRTTGDDGTVEFTTIFPGWYPPRAPHIHVKVHTGGTSTDRTYQGGKVNWTGQLFFDDRYGDEVYRKSPYTEHTGPRTLLAEDPVYAGGGARDGLMAVTGDADQGFTGTLTVAVDPEEEGRGADTGGAESLPPGGTPSGSPSIGSPSGPSPTGTPAGTPAGTPTVTPGDTPTPPPDSAASASATATP
ncbi:intradiol ring-cleavage dioxygenase [Streptomyces avermitilis]|uniref:intradiol ring-cleavage dioxygenase n=1 Tax=Streptomyces avermitilis TaxID=33903 RepID=UPI0033B0563F